MSSVTTKGPLKRKESMKGGGAGDKLEITPLGAGNEVGRSCVYMTYKGKTVLTTFKGRVFMTHAMKAIYKLLLSDFVKISKVSVEDMLYDEQDILRTMDKIEVMDFHQTVEVNGIKFWCYTAGHVLGVAMFMVDIAGVRVLYTGDYSWEEDRHLRAAEMPEFSPDVCVIESTYGVQLHQPRAIRERLFTETVHKTVAQGGHFLIPAFALGRAQELLLILDEYWESHPELHSIPIYLASPLAKKCLTIYQTYINAMNDRIRNQFEVSNPFDFKHISPLKNIENFEDVGPSVVMTSPGTLQSGLSRQLFDLWCQDKRNACVIPGYLVEGALAKTITYEPKDVTLMNGLLVPLNMHVHYISFSAHADYNQTHAFLSELSLPNIILVHGEANEMGRLKVKLQTQFAEQNVKVLSPKNCETVELFFKGEKTTKVIGQIAEKRPSVGDPVRGLLVHKGFTYQLICPEDLHVYTKLTTGTVIQRQSVPYKGAFSVLRYRLQQMYEGVEMVETAECPTLKVHNKVNAVLEGSGYVVLQWSSDPVSDMVADSIIPLILKLNSSNGSDTNTNNNGKSLDEGNQEQEKVKIMQSVLVSLFGDVKLDEEKQMLTITVDGETAIVDHKSKSVECSNEALKERIKVALRRIRTALYPLQV